MKKLAFITLLFFAFSFTAIAQVNSKNQPKIESMKKTDAEWKKTLTPQEYYVLREKGTDRASDGGYTKHFEKGTYICAACETQLFKSNSKYESHCGWPSFDDALPDTVEMKSDYTAGMIRTEITCKACGGHLGHIFDDGPKETTGKRYCVNTTSIKFVKSEKER